MRARAVLWCLLLVTSFAWAAPPQSPRQRLINAFDRSDREALERSASRLGPAGLLELLRKGTRSQRLAAIAALPTLPQGWILINDLLPLLELPDRSLSSAAARALRTIACELRPSDLQRFEESPASLLPLWSKLLELARRPRLALDIRTSAIGTLSQLREVLPRTDGPLLFLLKSSEPPLRRAAVELFSVEPSTMARSALAQLAASDPAPSVARAAAVALCGQLSGKSRRARHRLLEGVPPSFWRRLPQLVGPKEATDDELVELGRCLRRSTHGDDAKLLKALRSRSRRLRGLLS